MSIQWVKDVDSGELFPVVDDESFDIPDHLKDADYNEVDYDKTTKYTIGELQNKLLAAQTQINEIKSDTHANIVSDPLEEMPTKTVEISKSRFDWLGSLKFVFVVICLAVVIALSLGGLKVLSDEGIIDISVSESGDSYIIYPNSDFIESHSNNQPEASYTVSSEIDETETENNPLLKLVSLLSIIAVLLFTLKLTMSFLRYNLH